MTVSRGQCLYGWRLLLWIPILGCTGEESCGVTGVIITDIDTLDADQRKVMYDRYSLIALILPFVADDKMRSRLISSIASEHEVSKQTIRNYLCLYLAYMDMAVLAPKKRINETELTSDEKICVGL